MIISRDGNENRPCSGMSRTIFAPRSPTSQDRQRFFKKNIKKFIDSLAILAPWRSWRESSLRMPEQCCIFMGLKQFFVSTKGTKALMARLNLKKHKTRQL
jgi:hypothetical protein